MYESINPGLFPSEWESDANPASCCEVRVGASLTLEHGSKQVLAYGSVASYWGGSRESSHWLSLNGSMGPLQVPVQQFEGELRDGISDRVATKIMGALLRGALQGCWLSSLTPVRVTHRKGTRATLVDAIWVARLPGATGVALQPSAGGGRLQIIGL